MKSKLRLNRRVVPSIAPCVPPQNSPVIIAVFQTFSLRVGLILSRLFRYQLLDASVPKQSLRIPPPLSVTYFVAKSSSKAMTLGLVGKA